MNATAIETANEITSEAALSTGDLRVDVLAPGAHVVRAGTQTLALGFPEEVVKVWLRAGAKPSGWIVPDLRSAHGIVQWAFEFPLYYALFVQGTFGRGEKLPVIVDRRDWPALVEYLRLTLLGLSRDEMTGAGVAPERAATLAKESDYLALKRPDGSVAAIDDFLAPVFFDDEGMAVLGTLSVKRHGGNIFSFYTADDRIEDHRLSVPPGQAPGYTGAPATTPLSPEQFELVLLGASNGFDPDRPCSNLVVQAHGRCLLVDSGPYIRATLGNAGVSMSQLGGVVITHAHEDHAVGLSALLESGHRLRLFISKENAAIMRRKLAILNADVHHPESLFDDAFDVTLVEPGVSYDFFGLSLRFHYTFHSIPCTGLELSMDNGQERRRALIVGDSDSRAHIEQAAERGLFTAERLQGLMELYQWRGDLIIADAGEGAIHGAPVDFVNNDSTVVYVHTGALKGADRCLYTLGRAGHRYGLLSAKNNVTGAERGLGLRALARSFDGVEVDRLNALLDHARAVDLNCGHVLLREGDTDQDAFVLLCGELEALIAQADGVKVVARIEAGELFGERAAVVGGLRAATVAACNTARVLRIAGAAYKRFAESCALGASLPEIWAKRKDLDGVRLLDRATASCKHKLAALSVRRNIEAGATLIREGSKSNTVFVLLAGRVQVYKGSAPLLVAGAPVIVEPGSLIGETAPFLGQDRNASIVALDACEVLAIRGADFKRVVESSPQLFCHISRTVRQRRAA